ncbi:hypothetical protein TPHA_0M01410 [Tetrapisispora phaffii CBS 4417]|uniref:Anoctamin transmembrane domain-containing protein n=1 Tax=Tetrapisispora phaffii (strain ATCC 24235 / CBS 4417 / NBRC 1672 / NRRL Y-8282 / UCD 70-5) TaxID=1071381 RepID=G8C0K1_TETPH|nr:hypothetical protein TPHA_0M01410 [Tetrapisispora phaffii CBS 4417]CCE65716.1 hypothetical protein TPHA_0M01410 [Tetrapisispora phaffii CBS 4417]
MVTVDQSYLIDFVSNHILNKNTQQIEQLSADYCIVIDISNFESIDIISKNLLVLLSTLKQQNLINTSDAAANQLYENVLIRLNGNFLYVFIKTDISQSTTIDCTGLNFIKFIVPLNLIYNKKLIDHSISTKIVKDFNHVLPNDNDLIEVLNLNGNQDLFIYFIFFKKYIKSLFKISILGLILRVISFPYEFNLIYSVLLSLNSFYFIISWIYQDKSYYINKSNLVENLIQFNPVSNKNYKLSKSIIAKKIVFLPIILFFVSLLLTAQLFCFSLEIILTQLYPSSGLLKIILSLMPTILLATFVPILNLLYNKYIVNPYVNWENYSNNIVEINKSKLEKNILFTFCTNYIPLLITLFIYTPCGHLINFGVKDAIGKYLTVIDNTFVIDNTRYKTQLFFFIVTNQIIIILTENLLPIIINKIKIKLAKKKGTDDKQKEKENEKIQKQQSIDIIKQYYPDDYRVWNTIDKYQNSLNVWGDFDLDDNYKKIVSQFGYIAMFSSIWPLAPFISIIFNVIVFRLDILRAYKNCKPMASKISTVNSSICQKSTECKKNIWDLITIFLAIFGSIVTMTTTYMYRFSKLLHPYVADTEVTSKSKRLDTLITSPIDHSAFKIFVMAVIFEHLVVLVYYVMVKVVTANKCDLHSHQNSNLFASVKRVNNKNKNNSHTTSNNQNPTTEQHTTDAFVTKVSSIVDDFSDGKYAAQKDSANDQLDANKSVPQDAIRSKMESKTPVTNSGIENKIKKKNSLISMKSVKDATGTRLVMRDLVDDSSSSIAGATLPLNIPTSKNFNVRYDSDGNLVESVARLQANSKENSTNIVPTNLKEANEKSNTLEETVPKTLDPLASKDGNIKQTLEATRNKEGANHTSNSIPAVHTKAESKHKSHSTHTPGKSLTSKQPVSNSALNDNHSQASKDISSKNEASSIINNSHTPSKPRHAAGKDASSISRSETSSKKKKGLFNKLKVKL